MIATTLKTIAVMPATTTKQSIYLETKHFGLQELRFRFVNRKTIEVGTKRLNLHYIKERLDNQSFTIWLNDTKVITEISITLDDKTIEGVLVPMNRTVLQYQPFEDFYE